MLRKIWHRTGALLSTLLALLLFLPCGYPARAAETLSLEIPLLSPIEYTSKDKAPTAEETAPAQTALRVISQTAYDAFLMDHPLKSMWIDIRNSRISVTATSTMGSGNLYHWKIKMLKNQLVSREEFSDPKGMTERLQRIVENFTPTGDTLHDKVLSIHDYICASTVYDLTGNYVYSAYGALVDKRSVCEGYAEAFKLLCDQNGIPCVLVSGTGITSSGEENHMWNYVLMDDGKWYAVDTTWDDGKEILRNYFLIGSDTIVNSRNGKLFSENHKPDGDISRTGLKAFAYPTLSANAYTVNNPQAVATASEAGANNRWFYNQLDAEQKNFYDHLMTLTPPKGVDIPAETTTEPTTTTAQESTVTTTPATTPTPPVTTPDDTTTEPPVTTPSVTTPDTTTNPPITTPDGTTPEPPVTTPDTTEQTPGTTKPLVTTPPVTTEPSTTVTVPVTTDTDPVTTPKPTEPITTDTSPKTETDENGQLSDSTVTTDLPTTADTEETDDGKGQTVTDSITVSLDGRPESTPDTTTPGGNRVSINYVLRVIVIVLALLALFALIALTVIRFDRKQQ